MAAAAASTAPLLPSDPYYKQPLPSNKRMQHVRGLNPENQCKWGVLHKHFVPSGQEYREYRAAVQAPSWDSPTIVPRLRTTLDNAWIIEQAQMARAGRRSPTGSGI